MVCLWYVFAVWRVQPKEREELEQLRASQRAAVNFVLAQSQSLSNAAQGGVQERLISLG